MSGLGRSLILLGILLVAAGVVIGYGPRIPWLGKLPGDIVIKRESFSFCFPLTTCILVSLLLALIGWLFRR